MCQLLSDVDLETINAGRIPNHLDDLLWDGLKSNLRTLGLMYRTTDTESADGLIGELKTVTQSSKEITYMMKVMVDRFDEAQAKIKSLEAENSLLVAQIVNAYKKAILKARYDLLKEYKQGLLVDAEVDDEIELYEDTLDEAGCSSSAPADVTVPASNKQEPSGVEPPINVDLSEDREKQQ
ncbi:hypothetical protein TIFTF001_028107 [Ficus carica]|uniref:Uncharacterized protein n=1 Tax=Ficus carica TaxID=3494 RepID=A0AA88J171_FICCA|nr:hypothetical protein TIFTF001_028107 [Ficus carica]